MLQLPASYIREYKNFIYGHYLSEGVRITVGVVLPAVIFSYFGALETGIVVSLGAMCASIPDNPGPIHHRKNAMVVCFILTSCCAFITGIVAFSPVLLGAWVAAAAFIFSMIGVFNTRSMAIGTAVLLVMVLNIDEKRTLEDAAIHAAYIFGGGLWYTLLSLGLYSIRPYKLTQQAMGDCIQATANYLHAKAAFYSKNVDYDAAYRKLLEEQIIVHEKQDLVREMLFKSRDIVRESTPQGRILVMIFLDVVDLFERAMTSHQDYRALHQAFDQHAILHHYQSLIYQLTDELDRIGIALKSGFPSTPTDLLSKKTEKVNQLFFQLRDEHRTAENVEAFISLRHILDSIEDIAGRIYTLHQYTTFDPALSKQFKEPDYDRFVTHQAIDLRLLLSNLTLQSNTFRHAVRVSVATFTGYLISLILPFGHSYWILLTIIVILKPAYSLTKKRNGERLIGTIAGAAIGLLLLYFIQDKNILLAIMIFLMIGTFSFMRAKYLLSVVLMTPYILILFHLLFPGDFRTLLTERVIDTAIGSAIAFLANYFLVPAWEYTQIRQYMIRAIHDNREYFKVIAGAFAGKPYTNTEYKLSRKNAFVSLANLTDAFNRMMSEPVHQQKNSKEMHQFVVLNHVLTSHIATVSYYAQPLAQQYQKPVLQQLTKALNHQLEDIEKKLNGVPINKQLAEDASPTQQALKQLNHEVMQLKQERSIELGKGVADSPVRKTLSEYKSIADQFIFIARTVEELGKNVGGHTGAPATEMAPAAHP